MSGPRIGILDDYQDVALSLADWSSLSAQIEVFTDEDALVEALRRRAIACAAKDV